ncbi:MAG: hypothetical protein QOH80_177, partial [Actinomycetota bacterium]|nr:hypothetical protein [Actinomycetota bacterium]
MCRFGAGLLGWWSVVAWSWWFGSEGFACPWVVHEVAAVGEALQGPVSFVELEVVAFAGQCAVGDGGGAAVFAGLEVVGVGPGGGPVAER